MGYDTHTDLGRRSCAFAPALSAAEDFQRRFRKEALVVAYRSRGSWQAVAARAATTRKRSRGEPAALSYSQVRSDTRHSHHPWASRLKVAIVLPVALSFLLRISWYCFFPVEVPVDLYMAFRASANGTTQSSLSA